MSSIPLPTWSCGHVDESYFQEKQLFACPTCGEFASFPLLPYAKGSADWSAGIWRYRSSMPLPDGITLGEGSTPLIEIRHPLLAPKRGVLYAKIECGNPSGSYKDRGTAMVLSSAMYFGKSHIVVASTGNAGASLATYAARAGIKLTVVTPSWVDTGKLWQIRIHAADIRKIEGDFAACEAECARLISEGAFASGSDNTFRTEGTKTMAYEIAEQMDGGPDRVIIPIGTGSVIAAVHKGFMEVTASTGQRAPAIDGAQLIAITPVTAQVADWSPAPIPTSVATGINIAKTLLAKKAANSVTESGGQLHFLNDPEILETRMLLAKHEGIAAEPTACVTVAAYRNAIREGRISPDERVVVSITGHMLKNPSIDLD